MSYLPPAEKLPLAIRKDVRDNWESKKDDFEKQISDILGEKWTIDIDAKNLYPYAPDGNWAKDATGSVIAEYVRCAVSGLKDYIEDHGDDGKQEINKAASAHTLTMNIDVDNKVQYCGCGFTAAGQMVILFQDGQLSTNIDQCFNKQCLDKALDDVPSESLLTYETRTDIKKYYTDKIDSVKAEINQTLNKEYTFDVDFDAAAAKLNGTNADWKGNLGSFVFLYFQALSNTLKSQNFDSDDMLQEGLNEATESGKMSFRIVDSLSSGYGEVVFEDGILYLQTSPDKYGCNIDDVANKIVDQL